MQEASCPSVLLDFCSVRLSNFTSVPLAQGTFKHFLSKTKKLMLIARRKLMSEIFEGQIARNELAISFIGHFVGPSVCPILSSLSGKYFFGEKNDAE